ncbi:aldolase [Curtobacterium sp. MMLR14_010]|uniref:class II aldolase/adducin family protein n=1 Tax=Curtobacterium sp. MMLR14_010 TaxID=1898743 RepID=UPI0008DE62E9|nr:class II aldolase/adducin family protein [Curtobacterium sp. MMLR14_010]OII38045.1 aldolase [Curtobacterium sp. MMLR14_010]
MTDHWLADVTAALAAAGERLAAAGLSPGSSGNVSVVHEGRLAMTGTGTDLGALRSDDIAELTLDGIHVRGPRPSKEVAMHLAMYVRNPTHSACVHVHSPFSVAASCVTPWSAASAVPPITPYFVMRVGQTPLVPYRAPGDPQIGALIRDEPTPSRAVLLANHGQVVSGTDITDALDAAIELEEACRISLLTANHERRLLSDDEAVELAERHGTSWTPRGPRSVPPLQ